METMRTRAKPTKPKIGRESKWKPIFLVQIYRYIRQGMDEKEVHALLGVGHQTWNNWKKDREELKECLELAYEAQRGEFSFADYCYNKLPLNLRQLWDQIEQWEHAPAGRAQIELLLADHGNRVRQQLYVHALIDSYFSPSKAMSKVGVNKKQLDTWIATEPEFADLITELQWHKKNFFEEQLVKAVARGDSGAILFANRTVNKDRGYTQEVIVKHTGSIEHQMSLAGILDLNDLMPYLSAEQRTGIVEAIRRLDEDRQERKVKQLTSEEALSRDIARGSTQEEILDAEILHTRESEVPAD